MRCSLHALLDPSCTLGTSANMGMDLVPLNPQAGGYHAIWSLWAFLRYALLLEFAPPPAQE
jgi:hypothetical protein